MPYYSNSYDTPPSWSAPPPQTPEEIRRAQQQLNASVASGNLSNRTDPNMGQPQVGQPAPIPGALPPGTPPPGGPAGRGGYRSSSPYSSPSYQADAAAAANAPVGYNVPPNPIGFNNTQNPKDAFQNERARSTAAGDIFQNQNAAVAGGEYGEYQRSRNLADTAWNPIAQGGGGYSQPEANDILDRNRIESLQLNPQERANAFQTPDEQAASLGNTRSAFAYFNPQHIEGVADTGAGYERDVTNDTRNNVRNAYQDPSLRMDPMYGGVQSSAQSGMESGVRGAYNPQTLSLDPNFSAKYPLSDTEVQQQGDLGARMASSRYAALEDEAVRRGGAAGAPSLATAALKGRFERDAGINAADAGTSSRLAAMAAQREQRRQLEEMRLGAERYKTDTGTGIEFGLGQSRLNTNQDIEHTRLGAEQNRAGLATGSELQLGNLRAGVETGIANRNVGVAQANQNTGIGLEQYGEGESARRNYERGLNRQNTEAQLRNERHNTGLDVSDRVSGRTAEVAGARRTDETDYRNHLERRGALAADVSGQAADRQIQAQSVTGGQSLNAAGQMADYDIGRRNAKSWYSRNVSPIFQDATAAAKA